MGLEKINEVDQLRMSINLIQELKTDITNMQMFLYMGRGDRFIREAYEKLSEMQEKIKNTEAKISYP